MKICARTVEWQDTGQTCRSVYAEGHIGPHNDGLHGFDRHGLRTPTRAGAAMTACAVEYGFRRRCGWCGVQLRGWQLNLCRRCKAYALLSPSPPCVHASRWDAVPDGRSSSGHQPHPDTT